MHCEQRPDGSEGTAVHHSVESDLEAEVVASAKALGWGSSNSGEADVIGAQ